MAFWSSLSRSIVGLVFLGVLIPGSALPEQQDGGSDASFERIKVALQLLQKVPTGQALYLKAKGLWKASDESELTRNFRWGTASKTDAVLIRHFNPKTGEEIRERKVTVVLRSGQSIEELVLDMAHELVHATSRPAWDPYDPDLTVGKYIQAAIEGEGGEVQAVRLECQISFEFAKVATQNWSEAARERCRRYWIPGAELAIRRDFYRIGKWSSELTQRLGSEVQRLPLLSSDRPALYSSTGGAPYPVALYEEFRQINQVACENSRKRAASSGSSPGSSNEQRSPAAENSQEKKNSLFLQNRCH